MDVPTPKDIRSTLSGAVDDNRLLDTAVKLIEVPSPTRSATAVADRLDEILRNDGFGVERPAAGWADAPAVVARLEGEKPGKTMQFAGHLDTVHLPFVPPRVENGVLFGSGSADMKGGLAACVEAMRAVRDAGLLTHGAMLLTAYDLHEMPWGDGSQVNALIDAGYVGDAVLLPEYLSDVLPVVGRGLAVFTVRIHRPGDRMHEVLGGIDQPDVIRAGAEVVRRLGDLDCQLKEHVHSLAGRESVFVGQLSAGEIYNQSPTECTLAGTRRWLADTNSSQARSQFEHLLEQVAIEFGVQIDSEYQVGRDAFEINPAGDFAKLFQQAHEAVTCRQLPLGAKPFIDDGNEFVHRARIAAITHGPAATGAHTLDEQAPVDELVRVANVYALTAAMFCRSN